MHVLLTESDRYSEHTGLWKVIYWLFRCRQKLDGVFPNVLSTEGNDASCWFQERGFLFMSHKSGCEPCQNISRLHALRRCIKFEVHLH